jgi:hypothetical protein
LTPGPPLKRRTRETGDDIPAVRDWTWPTATGTGGGPRPTLPETSAEAAPAKESTQG